jgi:death-on-curing protein
MRYLTLAEVLWLHEDLIASSGGAAGLRDLGRLQPAVAQPRASYGDEDLYPTVVAKAGALGFALIQGHPFIDGNKRIGHAATEVSLVLNGFELDVSVDEQERIILAAASSNLSRNEFIGWLEDHVRPLETYE